MDTCLAADGIEVVDPAHPLFGRRFTLLSITAALQAGGFARVEYRPGISMLLPLQATSLGPVPQRRPRPTKLTPEALAELVAVAGESEGACPSSPETSGPGCRRPCADRSPRTSAPSCAR